MLHNEENSNIVIDNSESANDVALPISAEKYQSDLAQMPREKIIKSLIPYGCSEVEATEMADDFDGDRKI